MKVLGVKASRMNICSSHKHRSHWGPVGRRQSFQCKLPHLEKELLKKVCSKFKSDDVILNLNRTMSF